MPVLAGKPTATARSPTPPTSTEPTQNSANRIRDNQRRSRARRKEYILELEEKVRGYEQNGVSASAQIQAAARKVVEENEQLKREISRLRQENERLHRLLGPSGRDGEHDNNVEVGARESVIKKPSRKRNRGTDGTCEGESRSTMCGFGGLQGCTGPGCSQETASTMERVGLSQSRPPSPTSPASPGKPSAFPSVSKHRETIPYPSPPSFFHPHRSSANSSPTFLPQPKQPLPLPQKCPIQPLPPPSISYLDTTKDTDADTSTCHLAAQIITSMRSDISCEQVRQELGCPDKAEDCKVGNQKILSVMDKFA